MSGTTTKGKVLNSPHSSVERIRAEHNKMVDDLEAVRALVVSMLEGDLLLTAPTIAIGSDPTKVAVGAFTFQINGNTEAKAASDVAFTADTDDISDDDEDPKEAVYAMSVAAGGTISFTKGATAAPGVMFAPVVPAGELAIGDVRIQHDGSAIFDATTDELSAAHLTVVYTPATPTTLAAASLTAAKVERL